MEVGIRKGAWQRYPAYLLSLRCVYAVKKHGGWYTPYTRVYPPIHLMHLMQKWGADPLLKKSEGATLPFPTPCAYLQFSLALYVVDAAKILRV